MHDEPAILKAILDGYALHRHGLHGIAHWARVRENGLRLAEDTGADVVVVALFALFHDARRVNEGDDHGHGRRGGDLARTLRGTLVHLDDRRFELLYEACCLHTDGLVTGDVTLLTCWDADRLDLGRVGIRPRSERLGTDAARDLIGWAQERAKRRFVPGEVLKSWGCSDLKRGDS